jgi:hypothetical protein
MRLSLPYLPTTRGDFSPVTRCANWSIGREDTEKAVAVRCLGMPQETVAFALQGTSGALQQPGGDFESGTTGRSWPVGAHTCSWLNRRRRSVKRPGRQRRSCKECAAHHLRLYYELIASVFRQPLRV